MGRYYRFINVTKQEESTVSLPFNFGLSWAKSLENEPQASLKEKFDFVIEQNRWDVNDQVMALGDYGNVIYYPKKDLT